MSRSALTSEPPDRAETTMVDISTRTSRDGRRSFSWSMASSSGAPKRTAELSRSISDLAGSAISASATAQAVAMLRPALVALDRMRASSGICWTNFSRRRSRARLSQARSSTYPPTSPTTPNNGASTRAST